MIAAAETLAIDVADARALKFRAASGDKDALREAARQFESLMVAQMLKSMRQTRFSDEDDPLTGGESLKLYQGLLDQQWAAKMANGRGLGFADMLVKHLERQAGLTMDADGVDGAVGVGQALPLPASPARGGGGHSALPARGEGRGGEHSPLVAPPTQAKPASAPISANAELRPGERKQHFLESLRPHAEAAEAATGVPARFILAQAALESGWGDKVIRSGDGQSSFNLFGIKAGKSWSGESVEASTTEYRQGMPMKLTQRFRAYADFGAAFTDYANLLKSRFGEAVSADAETFAQGLANGGYATDPAYAGKLKTVIASVAMAGL
jgi:peptidoglycan hydrolase FlgJ